MLQISSGFISNIFNSFQSALNRIVGPAIAAPLALIIAFIAFAVTLMILVTLFVYFVGWFERKFMARAQSRHGPTYVGKYGILQNFADLVKLLSKENIVPDNADKYLFQVSIPAILGAFVLMLSFIPLTQTYVGIDTSIGLIVVFMLLSLAPILIFVSGWTSGNKFASIGAERSVVLLISYEIPLLLVIVAIAMLANSYNFSSIISAQNGFWFAVLMPIGFVVFFIIMMAEFERPPFDVREADSELIAGWLTDVSAPYYGLVLFLDYARLFTGSLLITVLFLGGYLGPSILPPFAWTIVKVVAITLLVILARVTFVRMRIDRILRLGWLYLTPLAIVNLLLTFVLFIH